MDFIVASIVEVLMNNIASVQMIRQPKERSLLVLLPMSGFWTVPGFNADICDGDNSVSPLDCKSVPFPDRFDQRDMTIVQSALLQHCIHLMQRSDNVHIDFPQFF